MKLFGVRVTVSDGRLVNEVLGTDDIEMRSVIDAKMISVHDETLRRDMIAVQVLTKKGTVILVNPSAQMEYAQPAVTLAAEHEFSPCDYGHVTAGEVRLAPTGADGNAIVCADCHYHVMGKTNFHNLKKYIG